MKFLLIYAHPNPASFNNAVRETIFAELQEAGHTVTVRDLYASGFDPVLTTDDLQSVMSGTIPESIKPDQDLIRAVETLIIVYPLWWSGMPAILKGYIDRVFCHGFAYRITEEGAVGLLGGKKVFIVTTTGAPEEIYEETGMFKSLTQTVDEGIFGFCNMTMIEHLYLTAVPYVTEPERRGMLERLKQEIKARLL